MNRFNCSLTYPNVYLYGQYQMCMYRHKERIQAMEDLICMARKGGNGARWDEHFKTLLLLLIETLGDRDVRKVY